MPEHANPGMEYYDFKGHQVSRVIKGNWQLAGGHGPVDEKQAIDDLFTYTEHGVNTFDMGDAYPGVEVILGKFRREYKERHGADATDKLRFHTKFIPDLEVLGDLKKSETRAVVERSLARLGMEKLDLVQFHWWEFETGDFVAAASHLDELRKEGLIEAIGLTNFDVKHTQQLLDAGIPVASNQIQFSLIDGRPFNGMLEHAQANNIDLFCYGTMAGGLLSGSPYDPTNRSHIKYGLVAKEAGDDHYATIQSTLSGLADKYDTTTGNIATRFALQTPGVSSVILGPRNTKHIDELDRLNGIRLQDDDYATLAALAQASKSPGEDIYSYERDEETVHAGIIHRNGNGMRPSTN